MEAGAVQCRKIKCGVLEPGRVEWELPSCQGPPALLLVVPSKGQGQCLSDRV